MLSFDLNIDILIFILLVVFVLSFFIQLFYYLAIFSRIVFYKRKDEKVPELPVSVIICAKNESKNLKKFLQSILTQDYPDYEVVVVNDCSTDDTKKILYEFVEKYRNLKVTSIEKDKIFFHGKKLALTIGIKAAKNDLLLLTDADCYVKSKNWLRSMQQNFSDKTEIVLGYGGYETHKGLLNKLIRYDTLFIALQYFTFALAGCPYMGVGRNLAYRKFLFFKNKGFASHVHLNSGDDDLFINNVALKENTKIEFCKQSHIRSVPEPTFKKWLKQKSRHITTYKYYKTKHKVILGGEVLSRMLYYCSFLMLLIIFNYYIKYIIGVFILRMIVQLIIIKKTMKRLNEKYLLLSSLLFDIILPFIILNIKISNFVIRKRNKWRN
jgi:glycosyltransferase involved in cell wall biosynthesis